MKKFFIICTMVLSYHSIGAQNKIEGKIIDQDNKPLSGASVFLPDMNKGCVSDINGHYELHNLPNGRLKVQFSFIGYTHRIESVYLKGETLVLDIVMKQTPIAAEEIVVSGGYSSTQHENAVKIDVLKIDPSEIKNTPNFMEALTKVPGVEMISKGSGVSKPVIRGLSMNDILVLNNNVRFENYQYSSHHPLGIDEFGIEDVEIIKGPASLLYGSDAIGGVINFIKEKPAPVITIAGDYNLQLFSNTLGMTNNFGIKGASKKFFGGIRAGQKTNADFLQGGGAYVPNSRFNEISLKANAGFTDKVGTFKLFYDYNRQKLGLVEDEAIEQISERGRLNSIFYQDLTTHLLSSQNKLYFKKWKLDMNASWQSTDLAHIGEENEYELQMRLSTITYEAKLHLPSNDRSEYIVGFQGFNQSNSNVNQRETILLPNASIRNYAAFGLLQYTFFKKLKWQAGVRYDYKDINSEAVGQSPDSVDYRPALDKDYGSFSGSLGFTYNITDHFLIRANFAAAYRTPNLAELTSNGPHELRYEKGDSELLPENTYESDLSMHYHKDNYTIDIAGFYNLINRYIFITPTGDTTDDGMNIFMYRQANSYLYGGEAGLHIHPKKAEWLHLQTTFAIVIGRQRNGNYLPFVPASKLNFEIRAEKKKLWFMHNAYISVNTSTVFNQNHPAPDETSTVNYTLLDLSIGAKVRVKKQFFFISLSANNMLDKKYIDHLSTLKEVALNNPGLNMALSVEIPFAIKGKE